MTLGQSTRAITTPLSYSHCQMCNLLERSGLLDQWSLTFWRRLKAVLSRGLGRISHNLWTLAEDMTELGQTTLWLKAADSIITWVPLPSKPPGDDAEAQVEATQARSQPHHWGTPQCLMRELCQGCWAVAWRKSDLLHWKQTLTQISFTSQSGNKAIRASIPKIVHKQRDPRTVF